MEKHILFSKCHISYYSYTHTHTHTHTDGGDVPDVPPRVLHLLSLWDSSRREGPLHTVEHRSALLVSHNPVPYSLSSLHSIPPLGVYSNSMGHWYILYSVYLFLSSLITCNCSLCSCECCHSEECEGVEEVDGGTPTRKGSTIQHIKIPVNKKPVKFRQAPKSNI